jgi:hypothetical protein
MMRMHSYGEGGHIETLPYSNLIEIVDYDDETGEKTVYLPPFDDVPPMVEPLFEEKTPEPKRLKGKA